MRRGIRALNAQRRGAELPAADARLRVARSSVRPRLPDGVPCSWTRLRLESLGWCRRSRGRRDPESALELTLLPPCRESTEVPPRAGCYTGPSGFLPTRPLKSTAVRRNDQRWRPRIPTSLTPPLFRGLRPAETESSPLRGLSNAEAAQPRVPRAGVCKTGFWTWVGASRSWRLADPSVRPLRPVKGLPGLPCPKRTCRCRGPIWLEHRVFGLFGHG
jgi:hypothetical protein